ncbi:hypothetical protein LOK49_LG02G01496 [Camellia lanceoleosa]|uniref:Uncharacterized protein n=1 Tax=Camellia lanceoleosa TaxID=1840588 RepID=A0ACC0IPY6_9ERIC|nr:hypothetical protein LOK49_LG02G01496 [Camellia lanceoleosa]
MIVFFNYNGNRFLWCKFFILSLKFFVMHIVLVQCSIHFSPDIEYVEFEKVQSD